MHQDLRYAVRMLLRQPGFSIVAIVTLALGIGANTAIFSLLDKVIVRPLPVEAPERLVAFDANDSPLIVSNPVYEALRDRAPALASLAAHAERPLTLSGGTHGERVTGAIVSGNYFRTVGITAAVGRLFGADEDRAGGTHAVAVISHGLWRRAFAADPGVIGRRITVNARTLTVAGVLPSGFFGTTRGISVDVYIPRMMAPAIEPHSEDALTATNWGWLHVIARLAPGATMAQAQAALDPAFEEFGFGRKAAGNPKKDSFNLGPLPAVRLRDGSRGDTDDVDGLELPLKMVMAAVGLVLLIACANIASLLLARAVVRRKEMGIRLAAGAGRGRIVRQLLTEGVLLASIGGAAAIVVASKIAEVLVGFQQQVTYIPHSLDAAIDARALAFAATLALLTGIVFGLAPARQALAADVLPALKVDVSAPSRGTWRAGSLLIVVQTALSIVVLVGALLCIKSLRAIQAVDSGIDTTKVMTASFDLNMNHYDVDRGRQFIAALHNQVAAQPGVESVAFGTIVAFSDSLWVSGARPEGYRPAAGERLAFDFNTVSPGYFRTLGTPLAAGREFTEADRLDAAPVAIVNEALVRRFWPGQNAVGKRLDRGRRVVEIVGVVRDTRARKITEEPRPTIFLPLSQLYSSNVTIHVRSAADPRGVLGAVRAEIQNLDPGLAVSNLQTLDAQRNGSLYAERLSAALLGMLGLLALTLVAIGLYGILSYAVTQRTREIGVRSALGAQPHDLLRLVMARGLWLTTIGIAAGVALSLGLVRVIRGVLFQVSPLDPPTFVLVPLGLMAVAVAACWLPARRAARLNPLAALRRE
ncbi:MAG TPA: ABC transporter permease [Vicinamibacterales bacterium]|nr:ABC transporter permease [Vicinamibacterales bacterium]